MAAVHDGAATLMQPWGHTPLPAARRCSPTCCWAGRFTALMQQGCCIQALAGLWSAYTNPPHSRTPCPYGSCFALWQAQPDPGPAKHTNNTSLAVHLPSFHVRAFLFATWAHLSLSLKTRMDVL